MVKCIEIKPQAQAELRRFVENLLRDWTNNGMPSNELQVVPGFRTDGSLVFSATDAGGKTQTFIVAPNDWKFLETEADLLLIDQSHRLH